MRARVSSASVLLFVKLKATSAPSRANASHIARPSPRDPPVTIATLPSSSIKRALSAPKAGPVLFEVDEAREGNVALVLEPEQIRERHALRMRAGERGEVARQKAVARLSGDPVDHAGDRQPIERIVREASAAEAGVRCGL